MAIPSRQIGQSAETNLLWNISKQLEYMTKVISNVSGGGSGTTTTAKEFISPVTLFTYTTTSGNHIYQLDKTTHKIHLINDVAVSSDGVAYDSVAIWTIDASGNLIITTSTPLTGFVRITGN